jgi:hypothetical protein
MPFKGRVKTLREMQGKAKDKEQAELGAVMGCRITPSSSMRKHQVQHRAGPAPAVLQTLTFGKEVEKKSTGV